MVKFLVKRLLGLIFVIFCVTLITFLIGYYAPGNPIQVMLGDHPNPALEAQLMHSYGLDLPWYQQYWNFIVHLLHFNFGTSYKTINRPVNDIIGESLPISLELGFWALIIQVGIGVPVGIISALKANTWVDTTSMSVSLIIYALPPFVLSILAQLLIIWLDTTFGGSWPNSQWGVPWQYSWMDIQYKLAPILVYGAAGMAYFARLSRTSMLEVLRQDYVRTARAKGLYERVVVYRHAFRNALIPLITIIGLSVGFLVAGAFFIESIFQIPGIANVTLDAVNSLDYPVVQATTVILAIGVVFGNLLSDICYTLVDPRIKAE
ncbi:ABC transporter permease [Dictyobacter arantiisoli]|uniref:Peptide ABC transporter permease n=1 Tax=Dictyobacter arantiisoli TaxID=2014874 RepID=A0A5A5T9S8_9CHLR|nr:ABC transporter permease [Dictyobacter arantiisoli]GCF07773.1 peptide ABC transporter permease [Dictyobacter arantiisoli]